MICVGSGFALTKADIFPAAAARGAGQIALVCLEMATLLNTHTYTFAQNIAMPSLMFSRIVPAFNSNNIHALGVRLALPAAP